MYIMFRIGRFSGVLEAGFALRGGNCVTVSRTWEGLLTLPYSCGQGDNPVS